MSQTQTFTLNQFLQHTGAAVLCANQTGNTTSATQVQTPPTSFPKGEPTKIHPRVVGTSGALLAALHSLRCTPNACVVQVCSRGLKEGGLTPSFAYSQCVSKPEEKGRWWLLLQLVGIVPTMQPAGTSLTPTSLRGSNLQALLFSLNILSEHKVL